MKSDPTSPLSMLRSARVVRVIDLLRKHWPNERWSYNSRRYPRWKTKSGWGVECHAELAPRYDGDDDNFTTTYRRTDTQERICF